MSGKFALLIGNGAFEDAKFRPLARPPADVDALRRVLADQAIGGFDEVLPLIDIDMPTARRQISRLFKNRSADDILLLFYAGHGVKDEYGELHLVMRDTVDDDLSATAIPARDITHEIDRSRSRSKIVILDCCFAGAFADTRAGEAGSVGTRNSFIGNGTGRVILTASDAYEYAWETEEGFEGEMSVFSSCLVQGLESGDADRDGDGIVTIDEWYDYVYERIQRSTRKQTPQKWVAGAGSIAIAASPRPPVDLEPDLTALIHNAYPRARLDAVRELAYLLEGKDRGIAAAANTHLARLAQDPDRRVSHAASDALAGTLLDTDFDRTLPSNAPSTRLAQSPPASAVPGPSELTDIEPPSPQLVVPTVTNSAGAYVPPSDKAFQLHKLTVQTYPRSFGASLLSGCGIFLIIIFSVVALGGLAMLGDTKMQEGGQLTLWGVGGFVIGFVLVVIANRRSTSR